MMQVFVSKHFLRALFNGMDIDNGVKQGLYKRSVFWQGETRPKHLPVGSRSVMLEYRFSSGQRLAVAHEYRERGSKRVDDPDPKSIHYRCFIFSIGDDC